MMRDGCALAGLAFNVHRQSSPEEAAMPSGSGVLAQAFDGNGGIQRHPRTLVSTPITLRHLCAGEIRMTRGVSRDLSASGMGAFVQDDLHVGDMVTIDVNLPEGHLNTAAIVRHSSGMRCGFEFLRLSEEQRLEILIAIQCQAVK